MQEWKRTRTIKTKTGSRTYKNLLEQVLKLEKKWNEETMFQSNITAIIENENYRKIISLAYYTDPSGMPQLDERVACILFDRIHLHPFYFSALDEILRHKPYIPQHLRGRIAPLVELYQRWGRSLGMTENKEVLRDGAGTAASYDELDYYDAWIENNPDFKKQVLKAHNNGMDVRHLAELVVFEEDEKRNKA